MQFIRIKIAPYKSQANFCTRWDFKWLPTVWHGTKILQCHKLFLSNEVVVHGTIIDWTMCTYVRSFNSGNCLKCKCQLRHARDSLSLLHSVNRQVLWLMRNRCFGVYLFTFLVATKFLCKNCLPFSFKFNFCFTRKWHIEMLWWLFISSLSMQSFFSIQAHFPWCVFSS